MTGASTAFNSCAIAFDTLITGLKKQQAILAADWDAPVVAKIQQSMNQFLLVLSGVHGQLGAASHNTKQQAAAFMAWWDATPYSDKACTDCKKLFTDDLAKYWWTIGEFAVAAGAAIAYAIMTAHNNAGYQAYSLAKTANMTYGTLPKIPKLTPGGGGGGGGGGHHKHHGGGGSGGGGFEALEMAGMAGLSTLGGLASSMGRSGSRGSGPAPDSTGQAEPPNSTGQAEQGGKAKVAGERVPDTSGLSEASSGFRFPEGWDHLGNNAGSPQISGVNTGATASAGMQGGMQGMPMMPLSAGKGGGRSDAESKHKSSKENAPLIRVPESTDFDFLPWGGGATIDHMAPTESERRSNEIPRTERY
ncbi:hypothetical protein [Mycobacterium montefiorense]|nr:hypothetical protein [Mycobacterium montefiorense]